MIIAERIGVDFVNGGFVWADTPAIRFSYRKVIHGRYNHIKSEGIFPVSYSNIPIASEASRSALDLQFGQNLKDPVENFPELKRFYLPE